MEQQGYRRRLVSQDRPFAGREHELPAVDHADWRRDLRRTILSRVVPRLSESVRDVGGAATADDVAPPQVAAFSDMVLAVAVPGLLAHVDALRAGGLTVDAVVLNLLSPAARRLGDLWLDDKLSFLDVTAGLGRLQGVMRALGPDFGARAPDRSGARRILLAPVPGEQHVFGLSVVAAFFRRAGWSVTFEPRIAFDDLLTLVRCERFTAVGLSVAGDRFLAALPAQVEALRRASLARDVALLAGGPAFLLDPDLHRRTGFDAVARDAADAVQKAEALSGQTDADGAAVRPV